MFNKLKRQFKDYSQFYGKKLAILLLLERYLDKILGRRKVTHYTHLGIDSKWRHLALESHIIDALVSMISSLFISYPPLPTYKDLVTSINYNKLPTLQIAKLLILIDNEVFSKNITATIKSIHDSVTTAEIINFDAILLYKVPWGFRLYHILKIAHLNGIPSLLWLGDIKDNPSTPPVIAATNFLLTGNPTVYEYYHSINTDVILVEDITVTFTRILQIHLKRYLPKVSLMVFNASSSPLNSYEQQDYQGEWEVIFINTPSLSIPTPSHQYHLISGQGEQYSWQQLMDIASGDLMIFVRGDDSLPSDFIRYHVVSHTFGDCDITLGKSVAATYPDNLTNLIYSNFSISRKLLISYIPQLENDFSISQVIPLNWVALELGLLLYQAGARFKYIPYAFHSCESPQKLKEGIPSLKKLVSKYPEIYFTARRYISDFYGKTESTEQRTYPLVYNKKVRILTYPWHISHQYELYKLPYEFTLVTGLGSLQSKGWNLDHRPIHDNLQFKCLEDVNVKDYDLVILHFDENILNSSNTRGEIGKDWGNAFKFFREYIDLPKVAICHGTPQFYGQYDIEYQGENLMQDIPESKEQLVDYLGDILTITNSHQANKEWGFKNTKVIWHGFDPLEFPPSTYRKGILAPFDRSVTSRPHYRGYKIYQEVLAHFPPQHKPSTLKVANPPVVYQGNEYARARFRNYVDSIRQYSVFFNPTLRSPMPRLRGEAMMCGLVNVSMLNHDVDLFIKNEVNGFYASEPLQLRDYLLFLVNNPQEAQKIGKAGRETAMDIFNSDRYLKAWQDTILSLI